MSDLDLDAITEKWQKPCGPHDYGMPTACTCPEDDPRNVIAALVGEVERLKAQQAVAETQGYDLVGLQFELDAARAEVERLKVEAGRLRNSLPVEAADYWHWRKVAELAQAEVERLKAHQQPDNGEWLTWYGHLHNGELCSTGREPDTHQRRVWTGPVTPIPSQSDSAASDTPPESTTDQTTPNGD